MKLSKTVKAASRLLVTSTMKPSMASMSFSLPNKPPRLHDTFLPFRVFLAVGLKLLLLNEVGIDAAGEVFLRRTRARLCRRLILTHALRCGPTKSPHVTRELIATGLRGSQVSVRAQV